MRIILVLGFALGLGACMQSETNPMTGVSNTSSDSARDSGRESNPNEASEEAVVVADGIDAVADGIRNVAN